MESSSTVGGKKVSLIRASVETETTAATPVPAKKHSKKNEEGVIVNTYKPKTPYIGKCLLNSKIVADDAPGETWHMVFSTEGKNSLIRKMQEKHWIPLYMNSLFICGKRSTNRLHCKINIICIDE